MHAKGQKKWKNRILPADARRSHCQSRSTGRTPTLPGNDHHAGWEYQAGLREKCRQTFSRQVPSGSSASEMRGDRRWDQFRCPHINDLIDHNLRFILGAKPGDHVHLFAQMDRAIEDGEATEFSQTIQSEAGITHTYRFVNGVSLNKSNPDLLVNVLQYWQLDSKGKEIRFSWVTDLPLTCENVYQIMRAARARWRIENEVFNTLKNQGYNLEHNFGLGEKHLSAVFNHLMMLAFLVDQIQQLCCPLFQAAWRRCKRKKSLWQIIRSYFDLFVMPSMQVILQSIVAGVRIVFR